MGQYTSAGHCQCVRATPGTQRTRCQDATADGWAIAREARWKLSWEGGLALGEERSWRGNGVLEGSEAGADPLARAGAEGGGTTTFRPLQPQASPSTSLSRGFALCSGG